MHAHKQNHVVLTAQFHPAITHAPGAVIYAPVGLGVVLLAAAALLWSRSGPSRRVAWLTSLGAGAITIGLTVLIDAMAALTKTGIGVTVFVVAVLAAIAAFWVEHVRRHEKHTPVRTPVLAAFVGVVTVMILTQSGTLLDAALSSPGKTSSALGTDISRVNSGRAAASISTHAAMVIGIVVLVILGALAFGLHWLHAQGFGQPRTQTPATTRGGGPARTGRRGPRSPAPVSSAPFSGGPSQPPVRRGA